MSGWDPHLYLRYADERTRAARDLLAQVPTENAQRIYDLGCGPGNSTELLTQRFPSARITGIDGSEDMLVRARATLPAIAFHHADLRHWRPEPRTDLLFANAVFQWLPDHLEIFESLLVALPSGGVLAVQMPDNLAEPAKVLMRDVAAKGPWADKLAGVREARKPLPPAGTYYDRLRPLCRRLDVWHAIYHHVMENPAAITEWMTGSGLRPYLALLNPDEKMAYLDAYTAAIADAYAPRVDGRVLMHFPRFFFVAVRA